MSSVGMWVVFTLFCEDGRVDALIRTSVYYQYINNYLIIAMKYCTDIHDPQKMNPTGFDDSL